MKVYPADRAARRAAREAKLAAEIAAGIASMTAASDWDDPEITDQWTELTAAHRRANGRCKLCGGRVSLTRHHRHQLSPTIDHRIPMSKGGSDYRENLQLAHRRCNSRKGDRVKERKRPMTSPRQREGA